MPTRDIVVPNQGESYQRDACHGFLLLVFGTILFPYSSNLIDGALAQAILQVVGGHSYMEAVLAETIRSLDYVREIRRGRMRGAPHFLQIWLLAYIRPFCSSHPFFYIIDERSLIARLLQDIPIEADRTPHRFAWTDITTLLPDRVLRIREVRRLWGTRTVQELYFPEHPSNDERAFSATAAYVAQFHPHGFAPVRRLLTSQIPQTSQADIPDAESSIQGAMGTELQSIREERDRLRCELVDTHSELTDHRELQRELPQTRARVANQDREIARLSAALDRARTKAHKDTPPTPTHSQTPLTQVTSPLIPTDISTAHSGVPIRHSPSTAQTASNFVNPARFTALEGMVNHLAANMATNMTELMAMLRNQNQASSSFTLPLEHRPIIDPNPTVPPTFVSEVEDASFSAMAFASTIHPISDSLPPPPAPAAVPMPLAAFLSADSTMNTLPPLTMSMHPPIYTVPPPTVPPIKIPDFKKYDGTTDPRHHLRHYHSKMLSYWDYDEFVIQTFQDNLMGSALDWFMTLKAGDVPTWTDLSQKFLDQYRFCAEKPPTLLDLSMTEMKEGQAFETYAMEWRGRAAKHIPPITERQQVQLLHSTLRGIYYSHLLAHTSSFSDLIEAGKKLDVGVKLGRIEGPSKKKDGETSKKQTTGTFRRGKDTTIGAVNSGHQASQPISVDYTPDYILLKHMHILCIMCSPTKHRRLISRPRQLLSNRNFCNSILLLRLNKVDPWLRDLLSRFNVLQPPELIRTMLHNRVCASSTPLY
ncbi:hypothetical protein CRG98_005154 [Punica granatum]|uniref:Retrotransposon gag domain-containing protein n=1 Tax=Punica granatum TaxID=22663 RepID=A0A2I0L186_PUNGR|nr:hypothetical protein CRG98_005154 [Punica granatum]